MYTCVWMWRPESDFRFYSVGSVYLIFVRQRLSLGAGAGWLESPTDPPVPCLTFPGLKLQACAIMAGFLSECWGVSSGPYASALPTEWSP